MTCDHCVGAVTGALSKVPGVEPVVELSRARNEAIIGGQPDAGLLVAAVRAEGYEAEVAQ